MSGEELESILYYWYDGYMSFYVWETMADDHPKKDDILEASWGDYWAKQILEHSKTLPVEDVLPFLITMREDLYELSYNEPDLTFYWVGYMMYDDCIETIQDQIE